MRGRNSVSSLALLAAIGGFAVEARGQSAAAVDEVIVTGTRRSDRTVAESSVPIDVISQAELTRQGSADMNNVLKTLIPSFNVYRFASADGTTFVRPPTLRGLPPDQILLLVNGKRRHRSALVQLNGGTLATGAQGPDTAQIPGVAIDRLEVLRDGASAQYGSDAIAGVINYRLKTASSGGSLGVRYGRFYAGDGGDTQVTGNIGLPLGPSGFVNLSGEYVTSKPTDRAKQRPDTLTLIQAFPNLASRVDDPSQPQGNPNLEAYKFFVNAGLDVGEGQKLYFFGNVGRSAQDGTFNYRMPVTLVGRNAAGTGNETFAKATPTFNDIFLDFFPDGSANRQGRVFNFASLFPAGYTPRFAARVKDVSATGGYSGEMDIGVTYDLSASYGQSTIDYFLRNTTNSSMGPESPTSFYNGRLQQRETNVNLDLAYPLQVGFASPLTIAGGAEFRRESWEVGLGEPASYAIGRYANVPLSNADGTPALDAQGRRLFAVQKVGSDGFLGYGPAAQVRASRNSYAAYIDLETDVTESLTLGVAGRVEDFQDFGGTQNGKLSGRYEFVPAFAVRAAISTGFRAPTPGQANTRAVSTGFNPGQATPVETATLPPTDPAAAFFGAKPLKPEKSLNMSAGFVLRPMANTTLTVDFYQIDVDDRLALSQSFLITTQAQRDELQRRGVANSATLSNVRYFTNAFDTRTQGFDVVGSSRLATETLGTFSTTLSLNYNTAKVTKRDAAIINNVRVANIEKTLPKWRGSVTEVWDVAGFSVMARASYYGKWTDTATNGFAQTYSDSILVDLDVSYQLPRNLTVTAGVENLFDKYPDKDIRGAVYAATGGQLFGQVYPGTSPYGFNGGFWYARLDWAF